MTIPKIENHFYECICHDPEHTIQFSVYPGNNDDYPNPPELYATIFLPTGNFFKRLWVGIKYIFGHKSRYGSFGSWTLEGDSLEDFFSMVNHYEKIFRKWENRKNA